MHTTITEAHIRSVSIMDSLVIANARYAVDHLELDAEHTVDMQSDEAADEPLPITDAEIKIATREGNLRSDREVAGGRRWSLRYGS